MSHTSKYYVESVGRALQILLAFSRDPPRKTLTQLAEAVGMGKSSVFRMVCTLEEESFLQRDISGEGYRLGPRIIQLGYSAIQAIEPRRAALPYLRELSRCFNESSSMTIRDRHEIVYVERVETQQIINVRLYVGSRLPVYCTSMGKVLLASLPEEEIRDVLANTEMRALGPNTITDLDLLLTELRRVRTQGVAFNDEELEYGHRAVAAPVRSHTGQVVAAINLSVPKVRAPIQLLRKTMAPAVVETAEAISLALGYEGRRVG